MLQRIDSTTTLVAASMALSAAFLPIRCVLAVVFVLAILVATVVVIVVVLIGVRTIEVCQDLVGRQVNVIDSVGVNLDGRVECAAGLGEVDARCGGNRIVHGHIISHVGGTQLGCDKAVQMINEIQVPRVGRIDAVFGIHTNGLLVDFA